MLRPGLLALVALSVAACDGGSFEEQQAFADQALLSDVEGVTRTDRDGTVSSRDAADWRIGPAYAGRAFFLGLPSPNPVERTGVLSFSLDVTGGFTGGLRAELLVEDAASGVLDFVRLPGADCPGAASPTICVFDLSARQIAERGRGGTSAARGLYRIVITDGFGIVSYGDVEITG